METKICSTCKIPKILDDFHKHKGGVLGRSNVCVKCTAIAQHVYRESRKRRLNAINKQTENVKKEVIPYNVTRRKINKIYFGDYWVFDFTTRKSIHMYKTVGGTLITLSA